MPVNNKCLVAAEPTCKWCGRSACHRTSLGLAIPKGVRRIVEMRMPPSQGRTCLFRGFCGPFCICGRYRHRETLIQVRDNYLSQRRSHSIDGEHDEHDERYLCIFVLGHEIWKKCEYSLLRFLSALTNPPFWLQLHSTPRGDGFHTRATFASTGIEPLYDVQLESLEHLRRVAMSSSSRHMGGFCSNSRHFTFHAREL